MNFKHIEEIEGKKYPWIGCCDGSIVLFNENKCGIVLDSSKHYIGQYRVDWIMGNFTAVRGEIILSND